MNEYPLIATRSSNADHDAGLGAAERSASIALGGALMINGIRSGGLSGILKIGLGAFGVIWGAAGRCALRSALRHTPFERQFQETHGWKHSEAISRSITVNTPLAQVIAFIRRPENVGALIPWIEKVESKDQMTSVWSASMPLGQTFQWTLRLEDDQDDTLHWRTVPESLWRHDITAHFKEAPGDRGTEVKVVIVGKTPLGKAGYAVAKSLSQFTDKLLLNLLHCIKQQLETGEVSTNNLRADRPADFFYVHSGAEEPYKEVNESLCGPVKTGVVLEGGNP